MLSRARTAPALLAAVMLFCSAAAAQASDTWSPQSFTLSNGLQAVVLPDHRAPVVTHMLWYRVGSADEAAGTGRCVWHPTTTFTGATFRMRRRIVKLIGRFSISCDDIKEHSEQVVTFCPPSDLVRFVSSLKSLAAVRPPANSRASRKVFQSQQNLHALKFLV